LKTASWILTPLLAGFLFYAFALSAPNGGPSALSNHIANRYQERSAAETGIGSPVEAVLTDYRSFDLLAVAVLFSTAALGVLFLFQPPPSFAALFFPFLCLGLGAGLVLGLGFLSLKTGSNFLDYEALAFWVEPARARLDGALILLAGTFLSLAGLLAMAMRWRRAPEGSNGR
jgi:multisubunit Na+/H+ antiporter MnhB subunit